VSASRTAPRDLARTEAEILEVATEHFTRTGYYGARIDEIAAQISATKRMIYYCFGSKDGLFGACVRAAYAKIRDYERTLHLADLAPADAIDAYVRETVRYHENHPELALLVRGENMLGATHLAVDVDPNNRSIIDTLDAVLERGRASGEFRTDVTGVELHVAVTALANYRITNEATIGALFSYAMRDPNRLDHDLDQYSSMMLGWLRPSPTPSRTAPAVQARSALAGTSAGQALAKQSEKGT